MTTRLENEQYLRRHPEVESLLSGFLGYVQNPDTYISSGYSPFSDRVGCPHNIPSSDMLMKNVGAEFLQHKTSKLLYILNRPLVASYNIPG